MLVDEWIDAEWMEAGLLDGAAAAAAPGSQGGPSPRTVAGGCCRLPPRWGGRRRTGGLAPGRAAEESSTGPDAGGPGQGREMTGWRGGEAGSDRGRGRQEKAGRRS